MKKTWKGIIDRFLQDDDLKLNYNTSWCDDSILLSCFFYYAFHQLCSLCFSSIISTSGFQLVYLMGGGDAEG